MKRLLVLVGVSLVLASPAAVARGKVDCNLRFDLKGWSVLYKTASGSGQITCDNGQKLDVTVSAKGGGLTVGKQEIRGGTGDFSGVSDIKETLGSYAAAEAHESQVEGISEAIVMGVVIVVGAVATVLTKGAAGVAYMKALGAMFGAITVERVGA